MKKRLVFYWFIPNKRKERNFSNTEKRSPSDISNYEEIHIRCLKTFAHVFDEAIFFIAREDGVTDEETIETIKKIGECGLKDCKYYCYENDECLCESVIFKENVLKNLDYFDGLTYYYHTKGITHPFYGSMVDWALIPYFFDLTFIDEIEKAFANDEKIISSSIFLCQNEKKLIYGHHYCYCGTHFWFDASRLKAFAQENGIDFTTMEVDRRWFVEDLFSNMFGIDRCHSIGKISYDFDDYKDSMGHLKQIVSKNMVNNYISFRNHILGIKPLTKKLFFYLWVSPDFETNIAIKAHKKCLKKYINIFDECNFVVSIENYGNVEQIDKAISWIKDICSDIPVNIRLTKNDKEVGESVMLFEHFFPAIEIGENAMLFFAHTKGVVDVNVKCRNCNSILRWIISMYYYNLEYASEANDYLMNGNAFYGAFKTRFGSRSIDGFVTHGTIYPGTFYWLHPANAKKNLYFSLDKVSLFINRFIAEDFPMLTNPSSLATHNDVVAENTVVDLYNSDDKTWEQYLKIHGDSDILYKMQNEIINEISDIDE